jgi:hypothetical protein
MSRDNGGSVIGPEPRRSFGVGGLPHHTVLDDRDGEHGL